jgi:predicted GNAT family N-acyltransferase
MLPTAQTAETTAAVAKNTPAFVFEPRPVLTLPPSEGAEIAPPLDKVYALEKAVFGDTMPPLDEWYTDMSHRLRHGCGKAVGIYEDNTLASAALVTLTTDAVGIIGGVATLPQSRGKGYARRTVFALACALQKEGKRALIIPKNAHADTLYRRWGATQTDTLFCGERV